MGIHNATSMLMLVAIALVNMPGGQVTASPPSLTCTGDTQWTDCGNSCSQNRCGRETPEVCITECEELCECRDSPAQWLDTSTSICYDSVEECPGAQTPPSQTPSSSKIVTSSPTEFPTYTPTYTPTPTPTYTPTYTPTTAPTVTPTPSPTNSPVPTVTITDKETLPPNAPDGSCEGDTVFKTCTHVAPCRNTCGQITAEVCIEVCVEACACPDDSQWLDLSTFTCYDSQEQCPTTNPTTYPTSTPTVSPTSPSAVPTRQPTISTGIANINEPTKSPTKFPSKSPTTQAYFDSVNSGQSNTNSSKAVQQCEDKSLNVFHVISLVISTILCAGLIALMAVLHYYRKLAVLKLSVMTALMYTMVGLLMFCASVLPRTLAAIQPVESTDLCLLSRWLQDVGYVVIVAPMILKAYSVRRIFFNPTLQKLKMRPNDIHKGVLGLVSILIVILSLWTAFSAPRVTLPQCVCKSRQLPYFLVSTAYQGILTLYGLHWAMKTKDLGKVLSEVKVIFSTLINCIGSMMMVGFLFALQYFIPDEFELQSGLETLLVTLVITQVTMFVAFKMLKPRYDKRNCTFNELVDEAVASMKEFQEKRKERKSQKLEAKTARTSRSATAKSDNLTANDDHSNSNGPAAGLGDIGNGGRVGLKTRLSSGKDDSSVGARGSSWDGTNNGLGGMSQSNKVYRNRHSSLEDVSLEVDADYEEVKPMALSLSARSPSHVDVRLAGAVAPPTTTDEEDEEDHDVVVDDASLDMSGVALASHHRHRRDGDDDGNGALDIV